MPRYVVALIGLPGAGKSTVAKFLLQQVALQEVNRDAIRHAMFPNCRYSAEENRAAVDAVHAALAVNCAAGLDSLVDGMTFARACVWDRLREQGDREGFRLVGLWLDCPPEVARERVAEDLAHGAHLAADRSPGLVDRIARCFAAPSGVACRIDASQAVATVCAQALAAVRERIRDASRSGRASRDRDALH